MTPRWFRPAFENPVGVPQPRNLLVSVFDSTLCKCTAQRKPNALFDLAQCYLSPLLLPRNVMNAGPMQHSPWLTPEMLMRFMPSPCATAAFRSTLWGREYKVKHLSNSPNPSENRSCFHLLRSVNWTPSLCILTYLNSYSVFHFTA